VHALHLGIHCPELHGLLDALVLAEDAIPVIEERLLIGKREVNRGSVRVRSYIVEEPVREPVQLREERVEVERRPVEIDDTRGNPGVSTRARDADRPKRP
jgi:stress response protein YsnF